MSVGSEYGVGAVCAGAVGHVRAAHLAAFACDAARAKMAGQVPPATFGQLALYPLV